MTAVVFAADGLILLLGGEPTAEVLILTVVGILAVVAFAVGVMSGDPIAVIILCEGVIATSVAGLMEIWSKPFDHALVVTSLILALATIWALIDRRVFR